MPRTFVFWRRSAETYAHPRGGLFDADVGISLDRSLALDYLHNVSKGVFPFIIAQFFHVVFATNAMAVPPGPWDTVVLATVSQVRALLFQWYSNESRQGRVRTQVQQLVPSMFGSNLKPAFELHASETNHFLAFLSTLLDRLAARMPNHQLWRQGLDALLVIHEMYGEHGFSNTSHPNIQRFCNAIVSHFRACQQLGVPSKPKHHFLLEMGARLRITGSLALSATFPDEGLNKVIKQIGQSAHRMVWSLRVLEEFESSVTLQSFVRLAKKRPRII